MNKKTNMQTVIIKIAFSIMTNRHEQTCKSYNSMLCCQIKEIEFMVKSLGIECNSIHEETRSVYYAVEINEMSGGFL